ncbi:MAG: hypothetical protein WCD04_18930 [Terriglobia bacterium]|jgi:hypothetical protein
MKAKTLSPELLHGIDAWRLLNALGIRPEVCHLNTGKGPNSRSGIEPRVGCGGWI